MSALSLSPRRLVPAACAIAVTCAGLAIAAGPPTATTTAATGVTATTATLTGTVAPNGNDTNYYFEYGPTTSYGTKTPVDGPVKGNATKTVSADVAGLAPSTTYHYRLVATNPAGTSTGSDMTFTTPGAGSSPSVSIAASKPTVTFGRPVTISGRVTAPDSAGVQVTLEEDPAPYGDGFAPTALSATTDATGAYSIVVSPARNTRYRVVTKGKDKLTSPEVTVRVRVKVGLSVSDRTPNRGQKVFFTGNVLPGHDGVIARIQRRTSTGWKTVATTPLIAASPVADATRSTYSRGLRIRRDGTFRVRVVPADGDHLAGVSRKRSIDVNS